MKNGINQRSCSVSRIFLLPVYLPPLRTVKKEGETVIRYHSETRCFRRNTGFQKRREDSLFRVDEIKVYSFTSQETDQMNITLFLLSGETDVV